jgi:hypothetical protein
MSILSFGCPFCHFVTFVTLLAGRLIAARLAGPRLQQGFAITSAVVSMLLLARGLGLLAS